MAVCNWCKKDMSDDSTVSCVLVKIKMTEGGSMNPVTYEPPDHSSDRCRDCNVLTGGFHHPGCCIERCPKCEGQAITCDHIKG